MIEAIIRLVFTTAAMTSVVTKGYTFLTKSNKYHFNNCHFKTAIAT